MPDRETINGGWFESALCREGFRQRACMQGTTSGWNTTNPGLKGDSHPDVMVWTMLEHPEPGVLFAGKCINSPAL